MRQTKEGQRAGSPEDRMTYKNHVIAEVIVCRSDSDVTN